MTLDSRLTFRDCPWCGLRHAQMRVHAQDIQTSPAPGRRASELTLLSCPECGQPVVIIAIVGVGGSATALPQGDEGQHAVQHLPQDVEGYYRDAIKVMRAGVPDAAAVQLRRTLEAAAAHYGIREKALVQSIRKLIDDGHVTKSFGEVLHHIRMVGNQGAHASDEHVDEPTADRALRFTTALLRNLFEVPAELKALEAEAPADAAT